jgi:hypothetical protein
VGCDAVCWQGATTVSTEGAQVRTARARKKEQRRQRTAARLNRVRSALTPSVKVFV